MDDLSNKMAIVRELERKYNIKCKDQMLRSDLPKDMPKEKKTLYLSLRKEIEKMQNDKDKDRLDGL